MRGLTLSGWYIHNSMKTRLGPCLIRDFSRVPLNLVQCTAGLQMDQMSGIQTSSDDHEDVSSDCQLKNHWQNAGLEGPSREKKLVHDLKRPGQTSPPELWQLLPRRQTG